jgi:hypothetical protein
MTVTVGIIIGVTLFFTICSIVLNRRAAEENEFSHSSKPAAWENGGRDLTSPMMSNGQPSGRSASRRLWMDLVGPCVVVTTATGCGFVILRMLLAQLLLL